MSENQNIGRNVIVTTDSDYAFAERLLGYKPMLQQFWKTATAVLDTEEQNKRTVIKANAYPFLVKDINITAFCKYGNFFIDGQSRDLVTVSFKSGNTDDYFMEEGIDISNFAVSKTKRITPFLIPANSDIIIELKHTRSVGGFNVDFPVEASAPLYYHGAPLGNTPSPFPIRLQINFEGAKLFKEGDRR